MTVKLGHLAKDKVSGFTGIAVTQTDFLSGNVQFTLQPQVDEKGAEVPAQVFDAHQMESLGPVNTIKVIAAPADTGIKLGEKVKDIVSTVEGIAIRRATFLNGCVYYSVEIPTTAKKEGLEHFVEYQRLERVGAGVLRKIANKLVKPVNGEKPPGGPAFRVPARG